MRKKLYRSENNKMIAGVCGGMGEYFNVDPTIIRLAWVLLSLPFAIFGGVIVYIAAALIIPIKGNYDDSYVDEE